MIQNFKQNQYMNITLLFDINIFNTIIIIFNINKWILLINWKKAYNISIKVLNQGKIKDSFSGLYHDFVFLIVKVCIIYWKRGHDVTWCTKFIFLLLLNCFRPFVFRGTTGTCVLFYFHYRKWLKMVLSYYAKDSFCFLKYNFRNVSIIHVNLHASLYVPRILVYVF